MTREEILRMAHEAGFDSHDMSADFTCNLHDIERFAALVAAAERERIKAERQPLYRNGCPVCGLGADGRAMGYVCPRNDCPTRITCVGAA